MPKKQQITREDVVAAALELVRDAGAETLGARAVAARLGVSTQPIFSHFSSMKELEAEVLRAAYARYEARIADAIAKDERPYRASGMAYIAFAREEPRLFRWLFMRDRSAEPESATGELETILSLLQEKLGLAREDALWFHLEMWVVVHGIATMTATNYLHLDENTISGILTDLYAGLLKRYGKEL